MADKDLTVNIKAKVDDDELDPFVKKVEKLENEKVTVEFDLRGLSDLSQLSQRMETLGNELEEAKRKAQALGQTTVTLRVQADDIAQVEQQLQGLAGDITRVDDKTIDITVNTSNIDGAVQGIRTATTEIDNLNNKASQALGGLGNLSSVMGGVGSESISAAQGVLGLSQSLEAVGASGGALAGISASMPVIGAAVAGVVLGIGLLEAGFAALGPSVEQVEGHVDDFAAALLTAETNAEGVKRALDAIVEDRKQQDFWQGLGKTIAEVLISPIAAATDILGGQQQMSDSFDTATERAKVFNDTLAKSPELAAAFIDEWERRGDIPAEEIGKYNEALEKKMRVEIQAKLSADKYNDVIDTITKATEAGMVATTDSIDLLYQQATAYLANQDAAEEAGKAREKAAKAAAAEEEKANKAAQKAVEDHAEAVEKLGDDLDGIIAKTISFDEKADHLNKTLDAALERGFAVHLPSADDIDQIDEFGEKIAELVPDLVAQAAAWNKLNPAQKVGATQLTGYTKAGREALRLTEGLADGIDKDLTQAFINSGGSIDAFMDKAHTIRDQLVGVLKAAKVRPDEITNFLEFLGLDSDAKIKIRFEQSEQETLHDFLTETIGDVQDDLKTNPALWLRIKAALRKGDDNAVLAGLLEFYKNNPAVIQQIIGPLTEQQKADLVTYLKSINAPIPTYLLPPAPLPPDTPTLGPGDPALPVPTSLLPPPPLVLGPGDTSLPVPTSLLPPPPLTPEQRAEVAKNNSVDVRIKPVLASAADITAGMTEALELPPGVDLTEGVIIVPTKIVPTTDTAAASAAKGVLDSLRWADDGKSDREAKVTVDVTGEEQAKKDIQAVADNNGKGYTAKIHVETDAPLPPTAGSGTGGGDGTGGGPRSVNVTQHIHAGAFTDRLGLQKTMRKANRQLDRLAGVRR